MELYYREFGEGLPLVILHGLYGSSDNWTAIARELSKKFRVILPDQRNHGRSSHDPSHTYDDLANDLHELVIRLGLGRFILSGHSMGGKTAIYFASRWPELVAALVIVDMTPFRIEDWESESVSMHRNILRVMNETDPSEYKSREEASGIFDKIISSSRIRDFLLKNITRNSEGKFVWKLSPAYLQSNLEHILDGFKREEAGSNAVTGFPVIFLKAEHSGYISDEESRYIYRLFPAAEIRLVEGTSHWLHAEKPEVFTETINSLV